MLLKRIGRDFTPFYSRQMNESLSWWQPNFGTSAASRISLCLLVRTSFGGHLPGPSTYSLFSLCFTDHPQRTGGLANSNAQASISLALALCSKSAGHKERLARHTSAARHTTRDTTTPDETIRGCCTQSVQRQGLTACFETYQRNVFHQTKICSLAML